MRPAITAILILGSLPVVAFSAPSPATVNLSAFPTPSIYGHEVTLTAAVTPGATGKVTFYDGVSILGTATIVSNQATLKTRLLTSGRRSLRAYYPGDASYTAAESVPFVHFVNAVAVNAFQNPRTNATESYTSRMGVADFNGDGSLDIIASVTGKLNVLPGRGDGTLQAAIGTSLPAGVSVYSLAIGDVNGDGKPDAVVGACSSTARLLILPGDGAGGFLAPISYAAGTSCYYSIAIGDFNRDGKPDVAAPSGDGNVYVYPGNGDGTFGTPVPYPCPLNTSVAVGDLNGDGYADLAIGSSGSSSLYVLFGKADGTFQAATVVAGSGGGSVTLRDFNGDGKLDVAVTSYSSISVSLGNGDGTFQTAFNAVSVYATNLAPEDFNGDGTPDLLVVESSYYVRIALNAGNGTFTIGPSMPVPYSGMAVVADLNGDGKPDAVLANSGYSNFGVLIGGISPDLGISQTHAPRVSRGSTGIAYRLKVANSGSQATSGPVGVVASVTAGLTPRDICGIGWTCGIGTLSCTRSDALAPGSSYPDIFLTVDADVYAPATVTALATVSVTGDENSANNYTSDTVAVLAASSVTLSATPNPSTAGQAVVVTATVTPGATGTVTFEEAGTVLGQASISGGRALLSTSLLLSGTHLIRALYWGDSVYGPGRSAPLSVVVQPVSNLGFVSGGSYPFWSNLNSVFSVDVNDDRKLDVVALSTSPTMVLMSMGNGDGTFRAPTSIAAASGMSTMQIGDWNGDGKPDLVLCCEYSGTLSAALGNGDGTFGAFKSMTGISGIVAVADFDGDGRSDLIVRLSVDSRFYLITSTGDGTFQSPVPIVDVNTSSNGGVGDVNGDGKPDFVFAVTSGLAVLLGNGNGSFQARIDSTFSGSVTCSGPVSIADFNKDGKADFLCGNYSWDLYLFTGRGDGTFNAPVYNSTVSSVGQRALGDFDGDGNLDVAVASYYDSFVVILRGKGDGTFYPAAKFPAGSYYHYPVAGDFNGDGRTDLAVASSGSGTLNVLLGGAPTAVGLTVSESGRFVTGGGGVSLIVSVKNYSFTSFTGTTTALVTLPTGLTATAMSGSQWTCTLATLRCTATADIAQGATLPDITLTVSVGNRPPGVVTTFASVLWTTGSAATSRETRIYSPSVTSITASSSTVIVGQPVTFTASLNVSTTGTVTFSEQGTVLGVVPLNGTQASLTARLYGPGVRNVRATFNGNPTYAPSVSPGYPLVVTANPSSGFAAAVHYAVISSPISIVSADFNRDGRSDLAVANASGKVSVLLGNGDGTFQAKADYDVGQTSFYTTTLVAGDFDGDGNIDLLMTASTGLVMFGGKGDGTFQPAVTYPAFPSSLSSDSLALVDVNSDGIPDAVVVKSSELYALAGGPNPGQTWTRLAATGAGRIVAGDWNLDGWPDLLGGGYLYTGSGDGRFTGNYLGLSGSRITTGDLNGGGYPDLVSVGGYPDGITVYLGNGNGTFKPSVQFSSGSYYNDVAVADMNGDGKLDVVATGSNSGQLALFRGKGDGNLEPASSFTVGTSPNGVVTGDFNGDGRMDVAVVNGGSNNVSILLGIYPPILTISAATQGYLMRGQTGAQYSVTIGNAGPGSTSGTVIFADTLPAGLTATAITGTGWSCTLANLTCSRSDVLPAASSYPPITIALMVSGVADAVLTNQLSASGGGSPTATAGHLLTVVNALSITGQIRKKGLPFPGVPVLLSGNATAATATDGGGNYYVTYLASGGTYTVTPTLFRHRFTPASATITGITSGQVVNFVAQETQAKLGIFRSGFWAVDTTGNAFWDATDLYMQLGQAGDVPVVGDFDGDGIPEAGVYRAGFWAIDMNHNRMWDAADRYLWLGQAGDVPIVGDFNGDGIAEIGVFRNGFWAIDINRNGIWDAADKYVWLGQAGDKPVVGDSNHDGISEMGIFRNGLWAIDMNRNGAWDVTDKYVWLGQAGDVPVVVDVDGDGNARLGIFRNGFWAIDLNSDGVWGVNDGYYWLGQAGDVPVAGPF